MAKMGRPVKEIDKEAFEKLCHLQCTKEEIACFFDVSDDTIERWCKKTYEKTFAVVFEQKRIGGLVSLRRAQFKLAERNAAMAIFLGKNYLGQSDVAGVIQTEVPNDGFIDALKESAKSAWVDEE